MDHPNLTDLINAQENELRKRQDLKAQIEAQEAAIREPYDKAVMDEFSRFRQITLETINQNNGSLAEHLRLGIYNLNNNPNGNFITFKDWFVSYALVRVNHKPTRQQWQPVWEDDLQVSGDLGMEVNVGRRINLQPSGMVYKLAVWADVDKSKSVYWCCFYYMSCSLQHPSWDGKSRCGTCWRIQKESYSSESLSRWCLEAIVKGLRDSSRAPYFYPDHSVQVCRQWELANQRPVGP